MQWSRQSAVVVFASLCAMLLSAGLAAAAAPAPLPDLSVIPDSMGVNIHFTDPRPGELEQIYGAGFRAVRMDFGWAGIERVKGQYDFAEYDRLLQALEAHHIRAYFILDYSNANYDDNLSPHTDAGRAAFSKWAAASVSHFKGHGIIWEMYNEPNIGFWKPRPNVDEYARLALAVGKALRDAEPGEVYIGPACSTIDLPFLETCFKAGCLEYWSAVSVHPYRQSEPETVAEDYRAVRGLIARYGPKGRQIPIISGEWGYSSAWEHFDEDRQGRYLPRELLTNLANDVPLSIWYDWHEDGKDPKEPEHHFGTVRPDPLNGRPTLYEPKPAFIAAKQLSQSLAGFRFSKRLVMDNDVDVLLFDDKAGRVALAVWTPGEEKKEITLPIFHGAAIHGELSGERNVGPDARGIKVTAEPTPQYIVATADEDLLRLAAAWTRLATEMRIAGPAVARYDTTLRNDLSHAVTVTLDGERRELKPGETATTNVSKPVQRQAAAIPVESSLEIPGVGRVEQRSSLVASNPLIVHIMPRVGDHQSVWVENPSADALNATAYLLMTGQPVDVAPPKSPLQTMAGVTEKAITFQLRGDRPKDEVAALLLLQNDESKLKLLEMPPTRILAVENFGDKAAANWTVSPDGDPKVASEQSVSDAVPEGGPPAPGYPCVALDYRFDAGWKFIRVAPKQETRLDGKPATLGIWIFGDNQKNLARIRFTDSTGQTFQPDGTRIDFTGWRYVEFSLSGRSAGHWGGANDGAVHFPIGIDTLFLVDGTREPTKGRLYLSTPTLVYPARIQSGARAKETHHGGDDRTVGQ